MLAPCLCVLFPSAQKNSRVISSADISFQKTCAKKLHQKNTSQNLGGATIRPRGDSITDNCLTNMFQKEASKNTSPNLGGATIRPQGKTFPTNLNSIFSRASQAELPCWLCGSFAMLCFAMPFVFPVPQSLTTPNLAARGGQSKTCHGNTIGGQ